MADFCDGGGDCKHPYVVAPGIGGKQEAFLEENIWTMMKRNHYQ